MRSMNKRIFILVIAPLMMISSIYSINISSSQNVYASTNTQSFCPPICLDEVQQHVSDARDALDEGKIVEAASELDIVASLLDQLDDMTSTSN